MLVEINGSRVPVTGKNAQHAVESQLFKEWVSDLDTRFRVKSILIQSVDRVGPPGRKRVLFIKMRADVTDSQGRFIPGVVFMRGGAVAVLVVLKCQGRKYALLTRQPRFPAGKISLPEIPAGMLDGSGLFSGVAAKELKEEAGFTVRAGDLNDLTARFDATWRGVYPSPGGCDESIRLFSWEKEVLPEELKELTGKVTGIAEEGEHITLQVVPLEDLPVLTPDAKALAAYALYTYLSDRA